GPAVGRAPARDRARRLPQRLSPPRRLPARERRHARLSARGAAAAGAPGGGSPPQALPRGRGRARAALGSQRAVPDRAAAAGGAAAPRPQHHGAAGARSVGDAALAGSALSGALAQGASAHLGGSAAGSGLSARQWLSPARVQRARGASLLARRRTPSAAPTAHSARPGPIAAGQGFPAPPNEKPFVACAPERGDSAPDGRCLRCLISLPTPCPP